MINPNEIRVGHYFNCRTTAGASTITRMDEDTISEAFRWHNGAALKTYEPIPLTHEWLVKLGFEYDTQHESFPIFHTQYEGGIEFFDDQVNWVGRETAGPIEHIKYVHQLQNLYFALTGEELTINETV